MPLMSPNFSWRPNPLVPAARIGAANRLITPICAK
jgi:hypothetical protein